MSRQTKVIQLSHSDSVLPLQEHCLRYQVDYALSREMIKDSSYENEVEFRRCALAGNGREPIVVGRSRQRKRPRQRQPTRQSRASRQR
ncbi:hypothetical protein EMIT047CA2_40099 [Pseudomonas soli]